LFQLSKLLPFLGWPRPGPALLRTELLAGLTVGLMAIPQGVAYALLAGMPLVTGIYASLLPTLVAVMFGASNRISVGSTALTCLLVAASLSGLAEPGGARWVELAVWLAILSGSFQLVLGMGRLGWLLNLVSAPILMAFTQAAAVLIIGSQIDNLLGLPSGHLWNQSVDTTVSALRGSALAFGLGSVAFLIAATRWFPHLPAAAMVVGGAAALSAYSGFGSSGGPVVGPLPQGLPQLALPGWPGLETLSQLTLPALVITLVSFIETAASAKEDNGRKGQLWERDQDLIGQGLAKIAAGVSGTFPTSASFSRSAINLYAGAQSGWANVCSVVIVFITLLWFLPVLSYVPKAVLAALVIVGVWGFLKPANFLRLWSISPVESGAAFLTFLITLIAAPRLYWGVCAGVVASLCHFLYQRLHPRIIEVGKHADGRLRDRHLWQLPALAPATIALRMDAALDFGSADTFENAVIERLTRAPETRHVVLFAQPINRIDATGVEMFARLRATLAKRGLLLSVVGLKLPVETVLRRAGELEEGPFLKIYPTEAEILKILDESTLSQSP